jgi:hypothetical protein
MRLLESAADAAMPGVLTNLDQSTPYLRGDLPVGKLSHGTKRAPTKKISCDNRLVDDLTPSG